MKSDLSSGSMPAGGGVSGAGTNNGGGGAAGGGDLPGIANPFRDVLRWGDEAMCGMYVGR